MNQFPAGVAEQLNFYVYLYLDPRDGSIFYVGKGKGDRVFHHLDEEGESTKNERIAEIRAAGLNPRLEILVHGLPDDETALRIESALIDLLGIPPLANQMRGWKSGIYGRASVEEIVALYAAQPVEVTEPALLIRINQRYRASMSALELLESTRGIWVLGARREKARYAMAVYEGVVREVYEIESWHGAGTTLYETREDMEDETRCEFVGRVASTEIREKYLLKSVETQLQPPSRNPVRYVNC